MIHCTMIVHLQESEFNIILFHLSENKITQLCINRSNQHKKNILFLFFIKNLEGD